jgi:TonB family protein
MYFNFEDSRPDTPHLERALTPLERGLLTLVAHLLVIITILVWPELPFVKAAEAARAKAAEEQRLVELERQRENARFVFVEPKLDLAAKTPPRRAELSDIDRRAATVERAPKPTNDMPFSRGNSPNRADTGMSPQPEPAPRADAGAAVQPLPEPSPDALTIPDRFEAATPEPASRAALRGPATGVLTEAIKNVRKYAQGETFSNPQGGGVPEIAPTIQFDTKGVEFGPWLRRFVAQVKRNWFIPMAAMSMRGHVVITFNIHRDGRITDVTIAKPSLVDAFTLAARNAILTSNPTVPLPPEYPDSKAFFTVTFYYNEQPSLP